MQPTKCGHYKMYGHLDEVRKKKKQVTQEWRPIHRPETQDQSGEQVINSEPQGEEDGFTPVAKKSADKRIPCQQPQTKYAAGTFEALIGLMNRKTLRPSCIEARKPLWNTLIDLSGRIHDAWCVLGDFNSVLYPGDRIRGTKVQDFEVKPLSEYIASWELQEVIHSTNGLSDYTPLILDLPNCPKPHKLFQFCNMWTRDPGFLPLISSKITQATRGTVFQKLLAFLRLLKPALSKLNSSKFVDLKPQQLKARLELNHIQAALLVDPGIWSCNNRKKIPDCITSQSSHLLLTSLDNNARLIRLTYYQHLLGPGHTTRASIDPQNSNSDFVPPSLIRTCRRPYSLSQVSNPWAWMPTTAYIATWWPSAIPAHDYASFSNSTLKLKVPSRRKTISYTVATVVLYQIWKARNMAICENKKLPIQFCFTRIKEMLIQRILFINMHPGKYTACIDKILGG
ncbi:hypothetical protein Cgig2_021614 [Carnegiea gigantea]|uniref:Uncharacterized protein n=1 Tax=Carnegiea gigantea TaxID=171969 RepID=A0A9Q1GHZ4_9CARY|nr:hypothetical protein Cgig2_021614 [Carnegiea gigantea]